MGMDEHMLSCVRALAENRIQDAKNEAIICCINDTTKKNEARTKYYKKLLENGSTNLFELPANLKGLLNMQDVSDFNENKNLYRQYGVCIIEFWGIRMSKVILDMDMPNSCSKCEFLYEFQGIKKCQLLNSLRNGGKAIISTEKLTTKRKECCPLSDTKTIYEELEKKSFAVDLGQNETEVVRLVDIEDLLLNQ